MPNAEAHLQWQNNIFHSLRAKVYFIKKKNTLASKWNNIKTLDRRKLHSVVVCRGSFVVELLCCSPSQFCCITALNFGTISVVLIIWRPDLPYLCGLRCRRLTAHSESSTGLWVSLQSCCIERVTHLWIYDGRRFTEGKEQEAGKKVMGLWLRGKSVQRWLYLQGCPIFWKIHLHLCI